MVLASGGDDDGRGGMAVVFAGPRPRPARVASCTATRPTEGVSAAASTQPRATRLREGGPAAVPAPEAGGVREGGEVREVRLGQRAQHCTPMRSGARRATRTCRGRTTLGPARGARPPPTRPRARAAPRRRGTRGAMRRGEGEGRGPTRARAAATRASRGAAIASSSGGVSVEVARRATTFASSAAASGGTASLGGPSFQRPTRVSSQQESQSPPSPPWP